MTGAKEIVVLFVGTFANVFHVTCVTFSYQAINDAYVPRVLENVEFLDSAMTNYSKIKNQCGIIGLFTTSAINVTSRSCFR